MELIQSLVVLLDHVGPIEVVLVLLSVFLLGIVLRRK